MSESPNIDFSDYKESENSHFRFIGNQLDRFHGQILNNWELMPSKSEFWKTADILEPRLAKTYRQTYMITLMGLDRASLILQGVLLEQMIKELYYVVNGEESPHGFGNTLGTLEDELSDENYGYIDDFRDKVRNNWIHDDNENIAEDVELKGKQINFSSENPEELLEKVKDAKNNLDENLSMDDHRVVGDLVMNERDKSAILLYPSTDKVVSDLSKKIHKKYQNKKK